MILVPMGLLLLAYQLGWYGYATLQQPLPGSCSTCGNGCVGFIDLLWPSRVAKVDMCMQAGWNDSNVAADNHPMPGGTDNQGNPISIPNKPVAIAPNGQPIVGYIH